MPDSSAWSADFEADFEAVLLLVDFAEAFAGVLSADLDDDLLADDLLLLAGDFDFSAVVDADGLEVERVAEAFVVLEDFGLLADVAAVRDSDFLVVGFVAAAFVVLDFSAGAAAGFVAAGLESEFFSLAATLVVEVGVDGVVRPVALAGSDVATRAATTATTRAVVSSRTRFMTEISLREVV